MLEKALSELEGLSNQVEELKELLDLSQQSEVDLENQNVHLHNDFKHANEENNNLKLHIEELETEL